MKKLYLQWQVQEQGVAIAAIEGRKDNSGIGIGIFVTSESDIWLRKSQLLARSEEIFSDKRRKVQRR